MVLGRLGVLWLSKPRWRPRWLGGGLVKVVERSGRAGGGSVVRWLILKFLGQLGTRAFVVECGFYWAFGDRLGIES